MQAEALEYLIRERLEVFYQRRLQKLSGLKLKDTLRKKNPYLFRAIGVQNAADIVEGLLQAYMSSSDETIFGDAFFEPIAKAVSGGTVSPHEAIDLAIETETVYKPIAVKSSPNIFNSSQAKRMDDEFRKLRSRLQKIQKQFDPLLGHCYGRVNTNPKAYIYRRRSGQVFWEELTGDPDFYLKLIRLMLDYPIAHRILYREEYDKAVNRFTKDFLEEFANADGGIDWEKLVRFNSSKEAPSRKKSKMVTLELKM